VQTAAKKAGEENKNEDRKKENKER